MLELCLFSISNWLYERGTRMKKVIVAGSRTFDNYELLKNTMQELYPLTDVEVICGGARGADSLGAIWAGYHKTNIHMFPADWDAYGKKAGYIRNREMGRFADEAVVFWDGQSKGTQHMINIMHDLGKPIHIIKF
jgi:hypothetical protein